MRSATDEELDRARQALEQGAGGEPALRALCAKYPADPRAHFLLGAFLDRLGRFAEAVQVLRQALSLEPDDVQALSACAAALQGSGRTTEAVALVQAALARQPANAMLWANFGILLEAVDDYARALEAYDRALALPGGSVAAWMNRGYVLTRLGRLDEALDNNQALAQAHPSNADFHFNVAELLLALHRHDEAVEACNRALAARPDHAKALIDRAVARAAMGMIEPAQRDLDEARRIDPGATEAFNLGFSKRAGDILQEFGAYSIYFHLGYERLERCDWAQREELVRSLRRQMDETGPGIVDPNIPFRALGFDLDSATRRRMAATVARAIEGRARARFAALAPAPARQASRIRLGYVSPDFRIHPAAFLTRQLYRSHDRSRFEVFGYSLTPDDGSLVRREVQAGFDVFREMGGADAGAIARQIRADGIEIAIDLSGYTNFARSEAFALRPAPLQVNWLGFPCTLGSGWMDYALVDGVVCPPGDDAFWSEKLVRLPHTYFITDSDPHYDVTGIDRPNLGLPADAFVFCCFNNAWKIEPQVFSVWMEILRQVPGSILWLLRVQPEMEPNLKREASRRGIEPHRLAFGGLLPNEKHLARYALADLFLDTCHYNAHTTAIDALREGTPVLTVPGATITSRVAASLLHAAELPELVCADYDQYRDKAIALARDPGALTALRARLRAGRGRAPLFDTPRFVRNLESAFVRMSELYRTGEPAQAFDVREVPVPPVVNRWH